MYFGLAAAFRFYFLSENIEKLFLGVNLGFNSQSIDGKTKAEEGGFFGLLIGLKAGYKLLIKDNFFFEPSLAYVYSKSNAFSSFFGASVAPLGWQTGLRIGFMF
jgi:outer membrane autotransporter protein